MNGIVDLSERILQAAIMPPRGRMTYPG